MEFSTKEMGDIMVHKAAYDRFVEIMKAIERKRPDAKLSTAAVLNIYRQCIEKEREKVKEWQRLNG